MQNSNRKIQIKSLDFISTLSRQLCPSDNFRFFGTKSEPRPNLPRSVVSKRPPISPYPPAKPGGAGIISPAEPGRGLSPHGETMLPRRPSNIGRLKHLPAQVPLEGCLFGIHQSFQDFKSSFGITRSLQPNLVVPRSAPRTHACVRGTSTQILSSHLGTSCETVVKAYIKNINSSSLSSNIVGGQNLTATLPWKKSLFKYNSVSQIQKAYGSPKTYFFEYAKRKCQSFWLYKMSLAWTRTNSLQHKLQKTECSQLQPHSENLDFSQICSILHKNKDLWMQMKNLLSLSTIHRGDVPRSGYPAKVSIQGNIPEGLSTRGHVSLPPEKVGVEKKGLGGIFGAQAFLCNLPLIDFIQAELGTKIFLRGEKLLPNAFSETASREFSSSSDPRRNFMSVSSQRQAGIPWEKNPHANFSDHGLAGGIKDTTSLSPTDFGADMPQSGRSSGPRHEVPRSQQPDLGVDISQRGPLSSVEDIPQGTSSTEAIPQGTRAENFGMGLRPTSIWFWDFSNLLQKKVVFSISRHEALDPSPIFGDSGVFSGKSWFTPNWSTNLFSLADLSKVSHIPEAGHPSQAGMPLSSQRADASMSRVPMEPVDNSGLAEGTLKNLSLVAHPAQVCLSEISKLCSLLYRKSFFCALNEIQSNRIHTEVHSLLLNEFYYPIEWTAKVIFKDRPEPHRFSRRNSLGLMGSLPWLQNPASVQNLDSPRDIHEGLSPPGVSSPLDDIGPQSDAPKTHMDLSRKFFSNLLGISLNALRWRSRMNTWYRIRIGRPITQTGTHSLIRFHSQNKEPLFFHFLVNEALPRERQNSLAFAGNSRLSRLASRREELTAYQTCVWWSRVL